MEVPERRCREIDKKKITKICRDPNPQQQLIFLHKHTNKKSHQKICLAVGGGGDSCEFISFGSQQQHKIKARKDDLWIEGKDLSFLLLGNSKPRNFERDKKRMEWILNSWFLICGLWRWRFGWIVWWSIGLLPLMLPYQQRICFAAMDFQLQINCSVAEIPC